MTTSAKPRSGLTYRDAGVDIDAGDRLVEAIKPIAKRTRRPEVVTDIGGFGALFALPLDRYRQPLLVAGTDGVGTKLKLAIDSGIHDSVGIDLVAMSVNDVVVQGAEPLFFLDYYATGRLDVDVARAVIHGIGVGCEQAGCALIGGETAEMPGMYAGDDYDLAGFCVGIVERDQVIDGRHVTPGDAILGLASSGAHSNGFSLIRRIVADAAIDLRADFEGRPLARVLLEPTRIYVKPILALLQQQLPLHAVAHITGGGLIGNVPRVLPAGTRAVIDGAAWPYPPLFQWLEQHGHVARSEMHRTFNCGIGMVLVVPAAGKDTVLRQLASLGERAWQIGEIQRAATAEHEADCLIQ